MSENKNNYMKKQINLKEFKMRSISRFSDRILIWKFSFLTVYILLYKFKCQMLMLNRPVCNNKHRNS